MLSLSPIKILIVIVVALLLVGPDKLPQVARQLGGAWNAFRSFTKKVEDDVRSSMPDLPSSGDLARYARSPVAILDSLAKLSDEPLEPDPGLEAEESPGTEGLRPDPTAPTVHGDPLPPQPGPKSHPQVPPGDPSLN